MTRRTYHQHCGLARGLDVVGERWTLLIVRELLTGPKRYTDLAAVLDGIGTSLLAARLRQLEADGIVARSELPPPVAAVLYELTEAGEELGKALVPLAIWGAKYQLDDARRPGDTYRAEWTLVFFAQLLDAEATAGVRAVYEFRIDDSVAALALDDGQVNVTVGRVADPDATITADLGVLLEIGSGHVAIEAALASGRVAAEGDPAALSTLMELVRGQ